MDIFGVSILLAAGILLKQQNEEKKCQEKDRGENQQSK
jgi:hypothetical protein